ncbi:phage/plasmid primase, P4 family [Sphingomonadaceae bacterium G21617-S1]|nr:phage/plasmid primase, P4 family [Sphingomonadaceae bacterium G21617-S1]
MNVQQSLPSPMCTAALGYARRGWKIFPCRERDETIEVRTAEGPTPKLLKAKTPYIGKWREAATTDEATIRGWWRRWPQAMIALPMGDNGLLALDFDPRFDELTGEVFELAGLKAATEEQIGCPLPISLASVTQSDGVHVIYKQPAGEPIGNRGNLPRHVDVRGKGGYIIAPPSILYREDGSEGRYRWIAGRQDLDPVEPPEPLVQALRERAKRAPANSAAGSMPASTSSLPPSSPAPDGRSAAKLPDVSEAVRKYAEVALAAECAELAATPKGGGQYNGRNQGIYHAGLKMGSLVAAGAIGEADARSAIQCVIDGMAGNEDPEGAKATLQRGLDQGKLKPRDLREIEEAARARASRSRPSSAARLRPPPPTSGEAQQSFRSEGSGPYDDGGGRGAGADAGDADAGEDEDERDEEEVMRSCLFRPHTDLGNAERFLLRYGRDFRWSPALGWLGWDGMRWAVLEDDASDKNSCPAEVWEAIFLTVRAIQDEAEYVAMTGVKRAEIDYVEDEKLTACEKRQMALYIETGQRDDAMDYVIDTRGLPLWSDVIRKWGRTTEAAGKISAIAKLARPKLAVRVEKLDQDPFAINVLNGTLRFSREWADGRWKAKVVRTDHRRADLITKLAPVNYDPPADGHPGALCPLYDDMIAWAQPKPEMRRYIHAWGGYSMSADVGEQKLQFWYGMGGNGKSTTIDAWCAAYGDYSDTIPIESFLDQGIKKRGDQASPDLAKLAWVRLLRTSEPDEGGKLATGLIKLVTGGEPVPVRHLNRGFFNLKVMFKLTISGNHKPDIRQTDDGIWRRVKLVHWAQRVKDEINPNGTRPKDPDLPKKLLKELDGIFLRLVGGLLDWMENGLIEPADVTQDTVQYRTENDPLARFLKLCTVPDPDSTARSSKLYELFQAWCKCADETEWKQKGFSRAMLSKGYQKKQSDGMYWLGMRIVRDPSDFVDPHTGKAIATFSVDDEPQPASDPPPPDDRAAGWGDPNAGFPAPDDDDPPL